MSSSSVRAQCVVMGDSSGTGGAVPEADVNGSALWMDSGRAAFRVGSARPRTPGPGELVVRVHAIAVNPVDGLSGLMRRIVVPWLRYPAVLGTDVAGVVEAVGPGVTRFGAGRPGSRPRCRDRAVAEPARGGGVPDPRRPAEAGDRAAAGLPPVRIRRGAAAGVVHRRGRAVRARPTRAAPAIRCTIRYRRRGGGMGRLHQCRTQRDPVGQERRLPGDRDRIAPELSAPSTARRRGRLRLPRSRSGRCDRCPAGRAPPGRRARHRRRIAAAGRQHQPGGDGQRADRIDQPDTGYSPSLRDRAAAISAAVSSASRGPSARACTAS